ncbi:hypothetical protein LB507_004108, partial [Fusarium sp. FIESC RH6]
IFLVPVTQPPMATRRLTFIKTRAPRAAGLSERDVDEHENLIRDLYMTQNKTRDQVIQHLKIKFDFSLSRDQFSKATRRWGIHKQRRGRSSIPSLVNEAAIQCTTSDVASSEPLSTATIDDTANKEPAVPNQSSKRPRSAASSSSRRSDITTHGPSSTFIRRLVKRFKARNESDDTSANTPPHTPLDFATDVDLMLTPSAEEDIAESRPWFEDRCDDELSADYLACCYRYNKAFWCYRKISVPFQYETFSPKQRRDRILNMARTAKTRRACEIVREVMESELERSIDPLSENGSNELPPGKDEICPMQSFQFHRHLAEIYERGDDGASLMQKHLDIARGFTKAFDTLTSPPIDLWTLLHLLPRQRVADIPEDLLNSLQWDDTLLVLNVRDCLDRCWRALRETDSLPIAIPHHDSEHHEKMKPTDMSQLAIQHDPFYVWIKTSFLFTFLWKKIQENSPPDWQHHTISATQFQMVMSRIIVRRSLHLSQHDKSPLDSESRLVEARVSDRRVYRSVVQALLHEHRYMPNQIKREFVTEFVEHYSWSPPAGRKSVFVRRIQAYQVEALESVLTARRESRPTTPTSTALKEVTTLRAETSEMRHISADNEFLDWLVLQQGQLDCTSGSDTIAHGKGGRHRPSFDSSSVSSYLRTPSSAYHIYLNAINGNPTISRSLASQSSRSSQVSACSSFKRFKASALTRRNSSESLMGLSLYDPGRQLQNDSFQELQDLQVRRYFKVTMGLSTLVEDDSPISQEEEYASHEGKPEEDEKPSVRGRIERLLKGKGKDDLNEREWKYNPNRDYSQDDIPKSIPYHLLNDASARPIMI